MGKRIEKTKRGFFVVYIGEKELGKKVIGADKEVFRTGFGPVVMLSFSPEKAEKFKIGILMTDNRIIATEEGGYFTSLDVGMITFYDGDIRIDGDAVIAEGKVNYEARGKIISGSCKLEIKNDIVSYTVEKKNELFESTMKGKETVKEIALREDGAVLLMTERGNVFLLNPEQEEIRKKLLPETQKLEFKVPQKPQELPQYTAYAVG